jgi:hypothetical protein
MSNSVKEMFAKVVAKLQKTEDKLERGSRRLDNKLDGILIDQQNFLGAVQKFFDQIVGLFKLTVSMLVVLVDSSDIVLYLVPAGMVLYVATKLTQII